MLVIKQHSIVCVGCFLSGKLLRFDDAIQLPIGPNPSRFEVRQGEIIDGTIYAPPRFLAPLGRAAPRTFAGPWDPSPRTHRVSDLRDHMLIACKDFRRSCQVEDHQHACPFREPPELNYDSVVARVVFVAQTEGGIDTAGGAHASPA